MQNIERHLITSFSFLEKYFDRKAQQCNQEINVTYSRNSFKLSISYNLDENFVPYLDVTLDRGARRNLMNCQDLFGNIKIEELESQLQRLTVEGKITVYS